MAKKDSKPKRKAKESPKANHAGNVILHLSDLHFGYDKDEAKAERSNALNHLASVIGEQESDWNPTVICITGDIAMRASSQDYSEAKAWLSDLLSKLNLTPKSLVICPGNHDIVRDIASGYPPPKDSEIADRILRFKHFEKHVPPFVEYQNFCSSLSIPPYLIGCKKSHLTGIRLINNIRFVCLNSAWFSQRNKVDDKFIDDGKLWIGLPLLVYLESNGDFPYLEGHAGSIFTIVIFHHPFEILHDNERNQRTPRKNTQEFIAYRSHLILTGHDAGVPADPTPIFNRAFHFRGGATYQNARYENSFHLIRLEDHYLLERRFMYQASSSSSLWFKTNESGKLYYWDYSKNIIEAHEKQKEIAKIENNINLFEEKMLQADYENGLKTLESSSELIIRLTPILSLAEKTNIKTKYSNSILNNLPFMTSKQNSKYREIMLRILSI